MKTKHLVEIFALFLFVVLTNKWMDWQAGIRYLHADDSRSYEILALAAFALSPYSFRYYWIAPTMLADLVFVFGLGILFWGLIEAKFPLVLTGAIIALLGRQSILLALPGVATWIALAPAWREIPGKRRLRAFAALAIATIVLYKASGAFVEPFTGPIVHGADTFVGFFLWLGAEDFSWRMLAEHFLRVFIPALLVFALSLGYLAGTARSALPRKFPFELWAAWLIAAGIGAQPLVVNPIHLGQNQSRQSAIALLAAVIATAYLLRHLPRAHSPNPALRASLAGLGACLALATFHHMYTLVGPPNAAWFAVLQIIASAGALAFLSAYAAIASGKFVEKLV